MSPSSCCFSFEISFTTSPELVAAPTEQQGLGAQRLVEQDLGGLFAGGGSAGPAAEPEALLTSRVLDDSVERDVIADDDLSHVGSPNGVADCH